MAEEVISRVRYMGFYTTEKGVVPADSSGFIMTRSDFEELSMGVFRFYEDFTDEEIIHSNTEKFKAMKARSLADSNTPKIEKDRSGIVYVIREKLGGLHKIGRSKNWSERRIQFETQLPHGYEEVHIINTENMGHLESSLHERFSSKRVKGEWFNLSIADIEYIRGL